MNSSETIKPPLIADESNKLNPLRTLSLIIPQTNDCVVGFGLACNGCKIVVVFRGTCASAGNEYSVIEATVDGVKLKNLVKGWVNQI